MYNLFARFPNFKNLPKTTLDEMAIYEFRGRVATQRPLLEYLFKSVANARNILERASETLPSLIAGDDDIASLKGDSWVSSPGIERFFEKIKNGDVATREMLWKISGHQAIYEDVGSALIIIASTSLERIHKAVGESFKWLRNSLFV